MYAVEDGIGVRSVFMGRELTFLSVQINESECVLFENDECTNIVARIGDNFPYVGKIKEVWVEKCNKTKE